MTAGPEAPAAVPPLRRILLPTDGTVASELAAFAGIDLASRLGATVVGFSVVVPSMRSTVGVALGGPSTRSVRERREADETLDARLVRLAQRARAAGVPFESDRVVATEVAEEIVDAAIHRECDLIVLGTHGREGVARLLKGSVAERVLEMTDVPVMIYRFGPEEIDACLRESAGAEAAPPAAPSDAPSQTRRSSTPGEAIGNALRAAPAA